MKIHCDRCQRDVEGSKSENFTSGYYEVGETGCWSKYQRLGESKVCDCCMWCDPKYIADYYFVEHLLPDGSMAQRQALTL